MTVDSILNKVNKWIGKLEVLEQDALKESLHLKARVNVLEIEADRANKVRSKLLSLIN